MQHFRSLDGINIEKAWLTIGTYDGVHLGHQAVIRRLVQGAHAAGAPAVVLTFFPPPAVVLGKRIRALYLTNPEEQAQVMSTLGVDVLITHPFDQHVAVQSAQKFLTSLKDHLGFEQLWVGYDFAMGHNRTGDVSTLEALGQTLNYQLHVVSAVEMNEKVVSSSRIRTLLADGDVDAAAKLLGRPYRLSGEVIRGKRRGHQLGFPTANLTIWRERALPGSGVYVCQAQVAGATWGAVTNIGVRPTFEDGFSALQVEAHLLDFQTDLYGQQLGLDFLSRLRGEKRFPHPQALVEQIESDIAQARALLNSKPA